MLPTLAAEAPAGENWVYEVKYDGFRAMLHVSNSNILLESRNQKELNSSFPEVVSFIEEQLSELLPYTPFTLDGEIVFLTSPVSTDFEAVQVRGRMKTPSKIQEEAQQHPCAFLAFDLLEINGITQTSIPFADRKRKLKELFKGANLKMEPLPASSKLLQFVPYHKTLEEAWQPVYDHSGEGIVAKHLGSTWDAGIRTKGWLKVKNYCKSTFFLTGYDQQNNYFHASVLKDGAVMGVGSFSHGISPEERHALVSIVKEHAVTEGKGFYSISPAICVELQFLQLYKGQLREPSFLSFQFQKNWEECTWEQLQIDMAPIHKNIQFTHPDKPLWQNPTVTKEAFIAYLMQIAPAMLPFLKDRHLTVIRFPHGTLGEAFYQKNIPDYAPDYISASLYEGISYIICNDLSTLVWLGNQLAIEFHIPFQTARTRNPVEIVFDLDPPSREHFQLAVKAALEMKTIFDQFNIKSYPKLSGNKGLQVHIPLTPDSLSYDQTRLFTEFIAEFLVAKHPNDFTVERLKKNRGDRLYIDYIQHAEGKTIICPYSLRGKEKPFTAAPLFWEDVNSSLTVEDYTMNAVLKRNAVRGCPFKDYFQTPQDSVIRELLSLIEKSKPKKKSAAS
ncbi:DNA ligase D [Bacillus lacus]|uniref:DNA ligase (ATP) n=1 Tax=Metabacillus lacus TaxID=1983721 RepID=A0A7X2M0U9_9BACI|nr:DNA ligase D [Metabacillus lacus]MRX73279.1 DNA ligase D [Metabacillus lacus]